MKFYKATGLPTYADVRQKISGTQTSRHAHIYNQVDFGGCRSRGSAARGRILAEFDREGPGQNFGRISGIVQFIQLQVTTVFNFFSFPF